MDRHRYQQIKRLFHEAAEVNGDARQQFLDEACGADSELAREVNRLFGADALHDESILDRPAVDAAQLRDALWDIATEHETHPMPKSIGGYRVTARLGRGGMGVVYAAEQLQPKRQVAVKLMHPGSVSPASIRRFQREAHILGQLQHPGIVQVYEASTATVEFDDGSRSIQPFVVMEMVQAEPLHMATVDLQFTLREKLTLIIQVCDAVQYAHQRGVVHRDLKPANILVAGSPGPTESEALRTFQTKVLDFGVARLEGRETLATSFATDAGQIIGTLAYMSPEQADGDPTIVDTRSDVYSIGVILYELLAGRPPFDIRTPSIVTAARIIQHEDPASLGTMDARLRGDVSTIVAKAMEKDVVRRYQSAGEMAEDIRRFLRDEPILARPATAGYLVRKYARRHKALVVGTSATVVALLLGLVGATWFAIKADTARRLADRRAVELKQELYASRIQQVQRIIETDGVDSVQPLLADCDASLRGWEWQRLNWLADRSRVGFRAHDASVVNLQYSPDGRRLLTSGHDGKVRLWDAEFLTPIREFELPQIRCRAQYSADGSAVVVASNAGRVAVLEAETLDVIWEHSFEEIRVEGAAVDPERSRVALGWWNRGPLSEVWDYRANRPLYTLAPESARGNAMHYTRNGDRLLAGTLDGIVTMQRADDGAVLFHGRGAKSVGLNAVLSSDESRIASIGNDGRLTLRDATTGNSTLSFDTRKGLSQALDFRPDGSLIAVGSIDGVVTLFDVNDGSTIDSLRGHDSEVSCVAFHPDGRTLASGANDGMVKLWDLRVIDTARSADSYANAAAVSADGRYVYFGSYTGGVRRWTQSTGEVFAFDGLLPHVGALTASDERGLVAAWMSDGAWDDAQGLVVLFDADLRVLRTWPANRHWKPELSIDGTKILTRDDDGTVFVRSTESGDAMVQLSSAGDQIQVATFCPDGTKILTGHGSGNIGIWSASSGALIARFQAHDKPVTKLSVPRSGPLLATWAEGEPPRIWDWISGKLMATIGNVGKVQCIAMLPDGSRLATGGADGNVRLWDVANGRELLRVGKHLQHVLSVAFSADGTMLISSSRDHTVRVWPMSPFSKP